jgi:glucosyl-dolichyl phosphate glucuronosyltransferase
MPEEKSRNNPQPDISVVVCTYNRSEMLSDTLQSWLGVDKDKSVTELIVVDNNSTDQTQEVVKEFTANYCKDLKSVFEPRPGLSFARNRGIEEAEGTIVAFVDDDIYFDKSWLTEVMRAFRENPWIDCLGGNSIPVFEGGRPEWCTEKLTKLYGSTLSGSKEKVMEFPEHPFGVNMAFRKDVFRRVGVFDPSLGRIRKSLLSNEEKDLFYRVFRAGLKTYYTPKAIIYHRIPRERLDRKWILRRVYWQGISEVAFKQLVSRKRKAELFRDILKYMKMALIGQRPIKWKNLIVFYPRQSFGKKMKTANALGTARQSLMELVR